MNEDEKITTQPAEQPQQPTAEPEPQPQEAEATTRRKAKKRTELQEAIREQAIEGEAAQSASFTLRRILGGEFLTARMLRRQIWVILMVAAFTLVYVSNRYSCQKDLLEINELNEKLKDAKYKALAASSELTEMCRESNVLRMLRNNEDSVLHIATQPPYLINVPEK